MEEKSMRYVNLKKKNTSYKTKAAKQFASVSMLAFVLSLAFTLPNLMSSRTLEAYENNDNVQIVNVDEANIELADIDLVENFK